MADYNTAKEIETNLKSGSKLKKAYVIPDYSYPVIAISAASYKTGKHGRGKTRFLFKDYFTEQTFSAILNSDDKLFPMDSSVYYSIEQGVVIKITETQCTVLTSDYTEVTCNYKELDLKEDSYVTFEKFEPEDKTPKYNILKVD